MSTTYRYVILLIFTIYGFYFTAYSQNTLKVEKLSKGADVVLDGKVVEQTSYWNEDRSRIYTNATIRVEEYLKGNTNENSVVVTYMGGEVGDVGELYTHLPRFENDEEVIVFLKKDQKTSNYKVFQGEEGKVSIVYNKNTGEKVTTSNIPISSLKRQIKSYLNEQ